MKNSKEWKGFDIYTTKPGEHLHMEADGTIKAVEPYYNPAPKPGKKK